MSLLRKLADKDVRAPLSLAETFDGSRENLDALIELMYRNKLTGAMGHADITGTKDDCFGAQID